MGEQVVTHAEINPIIQGLSDGLNVVVEFGWGYVLAGLIIIAISINFKAFIKWIQSWPKAFATIAQSTAKSEIYEGRILKLESDAIDERHQCDAKMDAMRNDYEGKIEKLEAKIDAMQDLIVKQSAHIAKIEERLNASNERAAKFFKKSGKSVRPDLIEE